MCTKVAPSYANIFVGQFESKILSTVFPTPSLWKRYIDDIFLVRTDTEESLQQFIDRLNKEHPKIKFTSEISATFLDLSLYKGEI